MQGANHGDDGFIAGIYNSAKVWVATANAQSGKRAKVAELYT